MIEYSPRMIPPDTPNFMAALPPSKRPPCPRSRELDSGLDQLEWASSMLAATKAGMLISQRALFRWRCGTDGSPAALAMLGARKSVSTDCAATGNEDAPTSKKQAAAALRFPRKLTTSPILSKRAAEGAPVTRPRDTLRLY